MIATALMLTSDRLRCCSGRVACVCSASMLIPISAIHRTSVDDRRVWKYRVMLRAGQELAPIHVRRWGAHHFVCVDGSHRVAAAWREGRLVIEATCA